MLYLSNNDLLCNIDEWITNVNDNNDSIYYNVCQTKINMNKDNKYTVQLYYNNKDFNDISDSNYIIELEFISLSNISTNISLYVRSIIN